MTAITSSLEAEAAALASCTSREERAALRAGWAVRDALQAGLLDGDFGLFRRLPHHLQAEVLRAAARQVAEAEREFRAPSEAVERLCPPDTRQAMLALLRRRLAALRVLAAAPVEVA